MTTATISSNAYPCRLSYNGTSFTIIAGESQRTLTLGLDEARRVAVGPELATLARVARLRNNGVQEEMFSVAELRHLADVRQRLAEVAKEKESAKAGQAEALHDAVASVVQKNMPRAEEVHNDQIDGLQAVADALKEDLYMLMYDIPDVFKEVCPNPSALLRQYAYRLNLSVWVVPQRQLNEAPIQELLAHWRSMPRKELPPVPGLPYNQYAEVEAFTVPYARSAVDELRKIAVTKLDKALQEMHRSMIERINNAHATLAAAEKAWQEKEAEREKARQGLREALARHDAERSPESGLVVQEAQKALAAIGEPATEAEQAKAKAARDGAIRGALRDASERFADAIRAAELFDETDALKDRRAGVKAAINAQITAANAMFQVGGRKLVGDLA